MERVTFLIERTRERVACLLNPESLTISRRAGIRPRASVGGALNTSRKSEDPVLFTGGGQTEMMLDLLFDVSVADSTISSHDVRDLTRPIRDLAQPDTAAQSEGAPVARFIWGKAWNVRGVVKAVTEKIESFTSGGVPRRSWLRMQFVHLNDGAEHTTRPRSRFSGATEMLARMDSTAPQDETRAANIFIHEMVGGSSPKSGATERLDEVAYRHYGDAAFWRVLAAVNGIEDPLNVPAGTSLAVPSLSFLNR